MTLLRLSVAAVFAYCSYALCRAPLLPLFASALGANPSVVGFVMGASTLTGVAVKLPAGALSDVFGRRPLLLVAAIVFAAMPFSYLAVSTLGLLIAIRFVHGSATAIFGPVSAASVSDMAPVGTRATWLSTYATAQNIGQALGPVIAGYVIGGGRFDLAFLISGALGLGALSIVASWPPAASPDARGPRLTAFTRGIREVASHPLLLATSVAQAAQFVLHGTLAAFVPLYGRDVIGVPAAKLGWLFGVQMLTTLALRPLVGMLSDRVGRRGLIVVGLTTTSLAVLLVSVSRTFPMLLGSIVIYAAGVAVTTSSASAYVTDLTRGNRYGAAHGVFGTIYDVGDALGPISAGLLVMAIGYEPMFRVMALVGLTAAAGFALVAGGAGRS